MDRDEVLAAFDQQVRRRREPADRGGQVELDGPVCRSISAGSGWSGVTWSDLDDTTADAQIARQVARFADHGPWEWKHYSYDRPADLAERLLAAGLTPQPAETLMVAEVATLATDPSPPPGTELVDVRDDAGVATLVRLHDQVFGGDHSGLGQVLLAALSASPPGAAAVLAVSSGTAVASGRVEFLSGTDFASLWGGGTLPGWRGRGIFRSLVAHRAAVAAARGFRYLQVDALPPSRPILARLGFHELAVTTPFTHPGRRS